MSKIKANASTSNRCEKNDGVHYVVEGNLWIDDVIFNFTLDAENLSNMFSFQTSTPVSFSDEFLTLRYCGQTI